MAAERPIVVLLIPHGEARSRRLELPVEIARWLRDELNLALGEDQASPAPREQRRPVKLHRGEWVR